MQFSSLQECEASLELYSLKTWHRPILGLANISWPISDHIILVKDRKTYKKLGSTQALDSYTTIGLVLEKKFLIELQDKKDSLLTEMMSKFAFLACIDDAALGLCTLSRPFVKKYYEALNTQVDGRQMGTCHLDPSARVSQNVFLGANVRIEENVILHPGVIIMGETKIGKNSEIFPGSVIYPKTQIGQNCRIHANVIIGIDGFGYKFANGIHHKIHHLGGVIIEDNVEIGGGSTIDMGTFSPTVIGEGSKLDNLVHIAHNVQLGKGVIICAHCAIAGSAVVGDYSVFGGLSGLGDNKTIGKGCQVGGGALVNANWPDGTTLGGHPARPLKEWLKSMAWLRKMSLNNNKES